MDKKFNINLDGSDTDDEDCYIIHSYIYNNNKDEIVSISDIEDLEEEEDSQLSEIINIGEDNEDSEFSESIYSDEDSEDSEFSESIYSDEDSEESDELSLDSGDKFLFQNRNFKNLLKKRDTHWVPFESDIELYKMIKTSKKISSKIGDLFGSCSPILKKVTETIEKIDENKKKLNNKHDILYSLQHLNKKSKYLIQSYESFLLSYTDLKELYLTKKKKLNNNCNNINDNKIIEID
jgi:hypothetical protein